MELSENSSEKELRNAKNPLYERVFRQIVAEKEGFETFKL